MNKKGQIWSLDIVIAFVIFLIGIMFFFRFVASSAAPETEDINDLTLHAKLIAGFLMEEGAPIDWNTTSVTSIGLTDGQNRFVTDKVMNFSKMDYQVSRSLLSTNRDFQVLFQNSSGSPYPVGNVTSVGLNITNVNPDDVISITRFGFHDGMVIRMVLYLW